MWNCQADPDLLNPYLAILKYSKDFRVRPKEQYLIFHNVLATNIFISIDFDIHSQVENS